MDHLQVKTRIVDDQPLSSCSSPKYLTQLKEHLQMFILSLYNVMHHKLGKYRWVNLKSVFDHPTLFKFMYALPIDPWTPKHFSILLLILLTAQSKSIVNNGAIYI